MGSCLGIAARDGNKIMEVRYCSFNIILMKLIVILKKIIGVLNIIYSILSNLALYNYGKHGNKD